MSFMKTSVLLGLLTVSNILPAAIHYVGEGPNCNGSNHHDSLDIALFAAALNGSENDEIRLTPTGSYTGNFSGATELTGWNSGSAGQLIIVGGYADCGSSNDSGITVIGNGNDAVFRVNGQSIVTFRNLSMTGSESRGLIVEEGSEVYLESIDISSNQAGVRVLDGAFVDIDEDSVVFGNGDVNDIPRGGGIWCFGNNSSVALTGKVLQNSAANGGNIYVSDGCFMDISGAAEIRGNGDYNAANGGGIMVDNGGELLAYGNSSRIKITDHFATNGGGVYVNGTGRATMLNVFVGRNKAAFNGSALYAINGGASQTQLVMDRNQSCDYQISCSEIDNHDFFESVIFASGSKIRITRTLIENNDFVQLNNDPKGMITAINNAYIQLGYSGITNNNAWYLVSNNGSQFEMTHITLAGNTYTQASDGNNKPFAWRNVLSSSDLRIENSIFQNTRGADVLNSSTTSGSCNLVENSINWPVNIGSYVIGFADFNNVLGGDARQQSSSYGVDMCPEDSFAWSIARDIEFQVAPVNENTNPQTGPTGGGLYDAGFDEVYDNIGDDEFLLTVQKVGSGEGIVTSDPIGIECGTDCTEVIFNNTLVELTADPEPNSDFITWQNCPLPSDEVCFITVTQTATVKAIFQPDDLIFSDGFE
jgi:hypothetical protein